MRTFFGSVERCNLKFLWAPRGDWPEGLISSLCRELDLVHVVDPFLARSVTKDFVYLRLHGGKDFKNIFSDEELGIIASLIPARKPAYVMFNNMNMWEDAARFQYLMNGDELLKSNLQVQ